MQYDERNDIWLFDNDLSEYQVSDEGKAVSSLLTFNDNDYHVKKYKVSKKQLKEAFEKYWDARNTMIDISPTERKTSLHYTDNCKLQEAKDADRAYSDAYREQN